MKYKIIFLFILMLVSSQPKLKYKNGDMIAELQDIKYDATVMRSPIMFINNKFLRIVLNDSELSIQQILNIPG